MGRARARTFQLNGGPIFLTVAADANGIVRVTITILNDGASVQPIAAIGLHLAAVGGPTSVRINGVQMAAKPAGEQNVLRLAGMGANGAPRTVDVLFTVGLPGGENARSGNGFARTGATILRWSLVAGVLVGLGALLVAGSRRRKSETS